jgi:hypothetical protein
MESHGRIVGEEGERREREGGGEAHLFEFRKRRKLYPKGNCSLDI